MLEHVSEREAIASMSTALIITHAAFEDAGSLPLELAALPAAARAFREGA